MLSCTADKLHFEYREFVRTHPKENPHGIGMLGDIKGALKSATDLVRIPLDVEPMAFLLLVCYFLFGIYQWARDIKPEQCS